MDEKIDNQKIQHLLAQLQARKEILHSQKDKDPTTDSAPLTTKKMEQVSENHVISALKKWNIL